MSDIFKFQQFTVNQQGCAMKIGTDAMLAGALANPGDAQNVLDIGSGTGVLALMLAQKSPLAIIDAIEPDEVMATRAAENFANSPWDFKLTLYHEPLQQYSNLGIIHYEYIVCNPPYFEPSPTTRPDRVNARSTVTLTFDELMENAEKLLATQGILGIIIPEGEYEKLSMAARNAGLHLVNTIFISSFENSPVIRRFVEFAKAPAEKTTENRLHIYNEDKTWSEQYRLLTIDFHNVEPKG